MDIQVKRATKEQQGIISNMSQFYVYEFSPLMNVIELQDNGLYAPLGNLDVYWMDDTRHAFLVTVNEELAGFALVTAGKTDVPNYIDEFFVLRKFNGKGVGKVVAKTIFDMFPGRWKVTQIRKNYAAQAFWRGIISQYTGDTFTEYYDEKRRSVQEFDNSTLR